MHKGTWSTLTSASLTLFFWGDHHCCKSLSMFRHFLEKKKNKKKQKQIRKEKPRKKTKKEKEKIALFDLCLLSFLSVPKPTETCTEHSHGSAGLNSSPGDRSVRRQ